MYVLELAFHDDERRLAARPAHRERLARLRAEGRLAIAGPWADDSGALLVFTTGERDTREIIDADPYYRTPGVRVVSLRAWAPIVGEVV